MKKRIVALALALAMVFCMASIAYAVPSKTTPDMVKPVEVKSSTGVDIKPDFVLTTVEDTKSEQVLAEIFNFVTVNNAAPVKYFPTDVQQEIAAKLPEGTNVDNLKMNEFVAIETKNFDTSYGAVETKIQVASTYKAGQKIVAVVGYVGADGKMVWAAIDAEVGEDGLVSVIFPEELLTVINNGTASLALLSE